MPGVTVINGTNAPINVSISIGFNWQWKNRLNPFESVELTNGAVFSLNAKYWALAQSEYDSSYRDIGIFSSGMFLGVIGLGLTIASGGTILMFSAGVAVGFLGVTFSALSIAVPELVQTPAKVRGINGLDNTKYLVTGHLDYTMEKGSLSYNGGEVIGLKLLDQQEYDKYILWHKPMRVLADLPNNEYAKLNYATKAEMQVEVGLDVVVWIYPAECGIPSVSPPCWKLNSNTNEIELSSTLINGEIEWRIEYVSDREKVDGFADAVADAFRIKNNSNHYIRIVSTQPDSSRAIELGQIPDESTMFFILRSGASYIFVPCSRQQTYLVNDTGGLRDGTKVLLSSNKEQARNARWAIDPVGTPQQMLNPRDLPGVIEDGLSDNKQQRVRMIPALVSDNIFSGTNSPTLCMEIQNDSSANGSAIQLGNRDSSSVDWQIISDGLGRPSGEVFLYSPNFDVSLRTSITIGHEILPIFASKSSENATLFLISKSMGYFCFQLKYDPSYFLVVEDIGLGKFLKLAKWNKFPRSMARWAVFPRPIVSLVPRTQRYIGVFSVQNDIRLDIGVGAMKRNTPYTMQTPTTRLVIKRIDSNGIPTSDNGPVCEEHDIRIYSEDGKLFLSIEYPTVGRVTSASLTTPTTKLVIGSPEGGVGNYSEKKLRYGDVVGIYSEDGTCRLDIGPDSVNNARQTDPLGGGHPLRIRAVGNRIP